MKYSITSVICFSVILISITGCITTKINVPDIREKALRQVIPLKIEYKNLPGDDSIAAVAPAGNKSKIKNETGNLGVIIPSAIEKILKNKGYTVVDSSSQARNVLTIDFKKFEIYWLTGLGSSRGELSVDISHGISSSGSRAWSWNYKNEKVYGKLPGNCIAVISGCTIIGIIPFFIYVNSQGGSEGTQMTKAGNDLLNDYLTKFEAEVPDASRLK